MNNRPQPLDTDTAEYESSNPAHIHNCPRKRIIIACDGTWMDSDGVEQVPSNITRIVRSIPPVGLDNTNPSNPKPISQITFYQNGIGTGQTGWYYKRVGKFISGATGEGLSSNIREAYGFICNNYHRGDEIILLGFSRGAFTARSISTLIKQLGLLTPKGLQYMVEICDDWEHQNIKDWKSPYQEPWPNRPCFSDPSYHAMLYKLQLTRRNIPVKCVGVWETVGALGMPMIALFPQPAAKKFAFVDTRVEDHIEYAFHALGLDEKRRSYSPTVWFKPPEQEFPRVLKQTWFPGVHSDIGGSYANDDIANITLAWMVGQLEEHKVITFNRDYLIRQVHRTLRLHEKAYQTELKQQAQSATSTQSPGELERAKTFGIIRPWGLGKIHNSYTLFFRLGGAITRTPMEHAEVSKATMMPTGRMLKGTHETMHASVRVRMALGGKGYDDKGSYISDALKGWSYNWSKEAHPETPWQQSQPGEVGRVKGVEWVKTVSREKKDECKEVNEELRMPEDMMTEFEKIVLRHWTANEERWEDGANEREDIIYSARPKRRETGISDDSSTSIRNQTRVGTAATMRTVREATEENELHVAVGDESATDLHLDTNVR